MPNHVFPPPLTLALALLFPTLAVCINGETSAADTPRASKDRPSDDAGQSAPESANDAHPLPRFRGMGDRFAIDIGNGNAPGHDVTLAWTVRTADVPRTADGTLAWSGAHGSPNADPIVLDGTLIDGEGAIEIRVGIFDETCFDELLRETFPQRVVIELQGESVMSGCGVLFAR